MRLGTFVFYVGLHMAALASDGVSTPQSFTAYSLIYIVPIATLMTFLTLLAILAMPLT